MTQRFSNAPKWPREPSTGSKRSQKGRTKAASRLASRPRKRKKSREWRRLLSLDAGDDCDGSSSSDGGGGDTSRSTLRPASASFHFRAFRKFDVLNASFEPEHWKRRNSAKERNARARERGRWKKKFFRIAGGSLSLVRSRLAIALSFFLLFRPASLGRLSLFFRLSLHAPSSERRKTSRSSKCKRQRALIFSRLFHARPPLTFSAAAAFFSAGL